MKSFRLVTESTHPAFARGESPLRGALGFLGVFQAVLLSGGWLITRTFLRIAEKSPAPQTIDTPWWLALFREWGWVFFVLVPLGWIAMLGWRRSPWVRGDWAENEWVRANVIVAILCAFVAAWAALRSMEIALTPVVWIHFGDG